MTNLAKLGLLMLCILVASALRQEVPMSETSSAANPFLPAGVRDDGWRHIRGRNFDGHSSEIHLAESWPDSGPPVLWVKELGQGYSSIVVQDNRAYTQYQSLGGQYVICMDASSGDTIWQYRYDWPFEATGLYPGPRSTPTIDNDKVYFAAPDGSVSCLSRNGKLLWSQDLKKDFDGKGTGFGYACSPTVIDGKVIMPVGGEGASMVALNAESGSIIWKSGSSSASYTPAYPIVVDGHTQVIGFMEHDLVAFDRQTGAELWKQSLSRGYDEHSAWPIFHESKLWTAAPFQAGSQLLQLAGGDGGAIKTLWQRPVMSGDVSSSVLVDGFVYGFDLAEAQSKAHRPSRGSFRCIDFATGDIMWSNGDPKKRRSTDYKVNAANQIIGHANVIAADGKLILFNDLGDLILARIDSHNYLELARTSALRGEICWANPALDRGRIFLRNHSRAVCLYIGEPGLLPRDSTQARLSVDDIPTGSVRDLSAILGVEPEYAMDPPTWKWLINWYIVSIGIMFAAGLIAAVFGFRWKSPTSVRWCFWLSSVVLGLTTGTIASQQVEDFVFTWPLVIFVALQVAVQHSSLKRSDKLHKTNLMRWQDRLVAFGFLAVCFMYFYACRRCSLATEWVFLCGFGPAVPFLIVNRKLATYHHAKSLLAQWCMSVVAYTAFHFGAAVVLACMYDLSDF